MNHKESLELAHFFPYQFSILAGQMSEYIAAIYHQQYGLTKFEWRVLASVAQQNMVSAKGIMEITRLDKMQVSRAIAKLKQRDILVQITSTKDKRSNDVQLTRAGHALYQEIVPLVKTQEKKLLAQLTATEQQQLIAITNKLSGLLDDESSETRQTG